MRTAIVTLIILAIAGSAFAADLGSTRDQKPSSNINYVNPVDHKQGGDTIFDATVIGGLPYNDTGTTVGYMNDYDEACPYTGSTSPDVVYTYTPAADVTVIVDLCGSAYDTKVYVYDSSLVAVACNDDFYFDDTCGTYVSAIQNLLLTSGETYYIVVDGYGGSAGDYILTVEGFEPCIWTGCPPDAVPEGEGHISDDMEDDTNGGCNSPEYGYPFTELTWINVDPGNPYDGYAWLCGITGTFFNNAEQLGSRDTDWFRVIAQVSGTMEFTVYAEIETSIFKLSPTGDCGVDIFVDLSATATCDGATLEFPVTAGEEVWLWVGPPGFGPPLAEWTYYMYVSNNMYDEVGVEDMSFGGVKALFR